MGGQVVDMMSQMPRFVGSVDLYEKISAVCEDWRDRRQPSLAGKGPARNSGTLNGFEIGPDSGGDQHVSLLA